MRRVAIVGSAGVGKSTFAAQLGLRRELPVYHLDRYYWRPGWIETPRDEWRVVQSELVEGDEWIIEGNYSATYDIRFARADTVIVLSASRWVCLVRALRRTVMNWHRDVQAPGCPEHFDFEFVRWIWGFPRRGRPLLEDALARFEGSFELVELRRSRDICDYLETGCARRD